MEAWDDVSIETFVVPHLSWHVRVHVVDSARTLHLAEGSFSAPDDWPSLIYSPLAPSSTDCANSAASHCAENSKLSTLQIDTAVCPLPDYSWVEKQQSSDPMLVTACKRSVFYRSGNLVTGLVAAPGFEVELTHPEPNTNLRYPRTILPMQTRVIEPGRYVFVSLYLSDAEADNSSTILIPSVTLCSNELKLSMPDSSDNESADTSATENAQTCTDWHRSNSTLENVATVTLQELNCSHWPGDPAKRSNCTSMRQLLSRHAS